MKIIIALMLVVIGIGSWYMIMTIEEPIIATSQPIADQYTPLYIGHKSAHAITTEDQDIVIGCPDEQIYYEGECFQPMDFEAGEVVGFSSIGFLTNEINCTAQNVSVGEAAGAWVTNEICNTLIGVDTETNGHNHCIIIGSGIGCDYDYQVKIGNSKIKVSKEMTQEEFAELTNTLRELINDQR